MGWKLGVGDAERIGSGPVLGHLTTATQLDVGSVYDAVGDVALHADAEVAVTLGRDVEPGCDHGPDQDRPLAAAITPPGPALNRIPPGQPILDNRAGRSHH